MLKVSAYNRIVRSNFPLVHQPTLLHMEIALNREPQNLAAPRHHAAATLMWTPESWCSPSRPLPRPEALVSDRRRRADATQSKDTSASLSSPTRHDQPPSHLQSCAWRSIRRWASADLHIWTWQAIDVAWGPGRGWIPEPTDHGCLALREVVR